MTRTNYTKTLTYRHLLEKLFNLQPLPHFLTGNIPSTKTKTKFGLMGHKEREHLHNVRRPTLPSPKNLKLKGLQRESGLQKSVTKEQEEN